MSRLISKKTTLNSLKKNNKFYYHFYLLNLKSSKYLLITTILLILYFIFRYISLNNILNRDDNGFTNLSLKKVKYPSNKSYTVDKDGSKLSENSYMDKYYRNIPTRVLPPKV